MQPVRLKDEEFVNELRDINADLFIVIAFRMLPEVVWNMPPMGTFNLHASLLPRYRGAAPINRAVMNGDTKTGVTTFMLKHEIDTGDILQQVEIDILPEENVGDVHDKLMTLGADLTLETVDHLVKGDLTPIPQDELMKDIEPAPAPKIFAEDCLIDWHKDAVTIHNQVRGLSPYPAARAILKRTGGESEMIKILKTSYNEQPSIGVGCVRIDKDTMTVGTGNGNIEIKEVHPAGKKRMDISSFLRGAHLGECFFE